MEQIKQGLDLVCTNQSTCHMHTVRLHNHDIVGIWGCGLVLDYYAKCVQNRNKFRMVKMTEVDNSLLLPSVVRAETQVW